MHVIDVAKRYLDTSQFVSDIPESVRIELTALAFLFGCFFMLSGSMLVSGVRQKFNKKDERRFRATKRVCIKDYLLLDLMQSRDSSYCITDPDQPDNPIVYSSQGFCEISQYTHEEVEGRNCRFLQGPETRMDDIAKIRDAVVSKKSANVELVNYKKDGTTFVNSFFLCPLFDDQNEVAYFVGVQCEAGGTEDEAFYSKLLLNSSGTNQ
jgi:PAS domain S-box-containing protein